MADDAFTPQEIDEMRATVRAIMEKEGRSQKSLSDESGVPYGTFTGWLAGTYGGNNDRVAGEVQIWLSSRVEKQRAAAFVPRVPGFIETRSAAGFIDALRYAHVLPDISVIVGGAGIGKTSAARHYARTNPNVFLATMDPSTAGTHAMLVELAETMGVVERSAAGLPRAIGRKVTGIGGLIIVDEAQHLKTEALDMVRSLYDRHGVGIALIGNEVVYARIEGAGKRASFAQLFSRIGARVSQARPKKEDMCALIEAWGVTEPEEIKLLKAIAGKPGALRSMTKVLQVASMIAAGAGETRSLRHLRAAYAKHTVTVEAEAA